MSTLAELSQREEKVGFKRILVATDFSEASRRALAYAVVFARMYGSEISLVHAIPPKLHGRVPLEPVSLELDQQRLQTEQELAHLAEEAHIKDYPHRVLLEEGRVWSVLAALIQRQNIGLLVLGTHGRGGLKKLLLGSVAEEVLRLAECPTLTVGPHALLTGSDVSGFRTIIYVTDFGPASAAAFPYALSLAEDCRAKFILLHMMQPLSVLDIGPAAYGPGDYAAKELVARQAKAQEESLRKLKRLVPARAKLASEPDYVVERDFLPDGILATARTHSAELIVLGVTRAHSPRLAAHMPGDLIHEVLCQANCPVLTVRNV